MKDFLNGRFFNLLMYTISDLVIPLIALDYHFPFYSIFEKSTTVQIGFGGFVAVVFILAFARKKIVHWVKGFDRVTMFRSIFMWLVFVFPSAFAFVVVAVTYNYGQQFLYIFGFTLLSHMVAGIFSIRAEKAKLIKFKRWVQE